MHQSFKPKLQKGPRRELLFSVYSIVSPPPATSISKMIIFKISKSQWFFLVLLSIVLQQQQKYFFPHWKEIIYCLSLIEKKIVLEFWRGRKNLQHFCFKEEAAKKIRGSRFFQISCLCCKKLISVETLKGRSEAGKWF